MILSILFFCCCNICKFCNIANCRGRSIGRIQQKKGLALASQFRLSVDIAIDRIGWIFNARTLETTSVSFIQLQRIAMISATAFPCRIKVVILRFTAPRCQYALSGYNGPSCALIILTVMSVTWPMMALNGNAAWNGIRPMGIPSLNTFPLFPDS